MEKKVNSIEKNIKEDIKKVKSNILKTINQPLNFNKLTIGQKAADILTKSAGSWFFIIFFFIFIGLWMATNIYAWLNQWDPYPFILLNLVLSCLAAIQAPVILMSQNRAAQRDRIRAEYDYSVNRRSEKEIQEIKKILLKRLK